MDDTRTQKSVLFPHTCTEQSENEINKAILFKIV